MSVRTTTDETFSTDVLSSDTPVLVDFTASWCAPCRQVAPILDQIAEEESARLHVVSLDVDENPATAREYGVLGMPTFALFIGGKVVHQFTGARPKRALLHEVEPHLTERTA